MLSILSLFGFLLGFGSGFSSLFLGLFDLQLSPLIDLGNFLLCLADLILLAFFQTLQIILSLLLESLLFSIGVIIQFFRS